jgi:hypothetical protein
MHLKHRKAFLQKSLGGLVATAIPCSALLAEPRLENPLTVQALDENFLDLTEDILPRAKSKTILANCWRMGELPCTRSFAKSTTV